MLPERKSARRFSHDTSTVEVCLSNEEVAERGQAIPPDNRPRSDTPLRDCDKRQESALSVARKALKEAEAKIKTVAAAAPQDRKSAYDEWKRDGYRDISGEGDTDHTEETLFEYTPANNPLIKKVSVKKWPARYTFYERFRTDALKYYQKASAPCSRVPFFSYTPQYSQLSDEQLSYYLYWREQVRSENYPSADFAYILLYIYEIINLPDMISPEKGADLLCQIWREYRKKYPKLDKIMPDWLCDYCLIGKIDPPSALCRDFIDPATGSLFLREYYAGYDASSPSPYASALFSCASDYNYRNSKFITPENRELFDRHIKDAFLYAFGKAEAENKTIFAPLGRKSMMNISITRDAFSGAVCAYNMKRRIELEYLSCSRSIELRFAVTDMIKYAENHVRAMLGIRSRFHTPNLAMPLKRAADEYFAPFKKRIKMVTEKTCPEYEKQYEAGNSDFSIDYAVSLEEKSWETTSLLVGDSNDYDEENFLSRGDSPVNHVEERSEEPKKNDSAEETASNPAVSGSEPVKTALKALLDQDTERFATIAKSQNLLPDTLCELINDTLYDEIGDAVVTCEEKQFRLIPDYTEDIIEWMKK